MATGERHRLCILLAERSKDGKPLCPYCLAFSLWCRIVLLTRSARWEGYGELGSGLYPNPVRNYMPLGPFPPAIIGRSESSFPLAGRTWTLAKRIQRQIFFLELWQVYLKILQYLVAYNRASRDRLTWAHFLSSLNRGGAESGSAVYLMGFYLNEEGTLHAVIPKVLYPPERLLRAPNIRAVSHEPRWDPGITGEELSIKEYLSDPFQGDGGRDGPESRLRTKRELAILGSLFSFY